MLAAAAAATQALPPPVRALLDWQPSLATSEPWRWWTAAFVHYGAAHLTANLAGCAMLAALGAAAQMHGRWTWAWAAAWPLAHLLLWGVPGLVHYGGLSGLLHAAVAVVAIALLTETPDPDGGTRSPRLRESPPHAPDVADDRGRGRTRRRVGTAIGLGLLLKLLLEQGLGPVPSVGLAIDVPVAVAAHLTGAVAGAACALAAAVLARLGATMRS